MSLYKLIQKNIDWEWKSKQQMAFDGIKKALMTASVFMDPNFEKPFIPKTDVSNLQIGAVFLQKSNEDGKEHVIVFADHSLSNAKWSYSVIEWDALTFV